MTELSALFNTEFLVAAIRLATPIALAAMGATICERSGIINIAMEGIMLIGAFFAAWFAWITGNPWIGMIGGVLAGAVISLFHAWATITLHLNHVVSGAVINILGFGVTRYLMALIYKRQGTSEIIHNTLASYRWAVPGLSKIPVLGPVFFDQTPIVYITFILIFYFTWMMRRSRTGLHIKAAGEHPIALETLGISVKKIRYKAVLISGMACGLAGAYLSIENSNSFSEGMTSGRGFIALGANIAGGWTAIGSAIAALFFGLVDAFALRIQVHQIFNVPSEIFLVFPYVAAVIAVAGLVRKSRAPKALGQDFAIEQSDID
jgi:general nucleoside transport system permease protein